MKNKMKLIGHLTASIIVALLLFFYATTSQYRSKVVPAQPSTTENYSHMLNYIPVEMEYDKTQFYISGFSSTVSVELSGSNRILLQQETEDATRHFKVKADLTDLGVGTHTVKLEVVDLPSGVTATLQPSSVTVQIGKLATSDFVVRPEIPDAQIEKGYHIDQVKLGSEKITITTDETTLHRIQYVQAVIDTDKPLKGDYKGTAKLQAVDGGGEVLPVSLSTDDTPIEITIVKDN